MCTPERGPSAFLGYPGQHCRHHWGIPVPRAGGCWLLRLSSGDHMPPIGRPVLSFPYSSSLSPSNPFLGSSEASCLPGVALFTFRCLGNPICPLRPRSELPSQFLPSPSQRQEGLLTVGYPLTSSSGVHGRPGTTWWQSPHGEGPEGKREHPGFRLRRDFAVTMEPLRGQYAPADGPQFPCLYSGTRCSVRVFQPRPSCPLVLHQDLGTAQGLLPGRLVVCRVRSV